MHCYNCGADYDDQLLECPYCSAENTEKVKNLHENYIKNYKNKEKELDKSLEKAKKSTPKMVIVLIIVASAIALFFGVVVIGALIVKNKRDNQMDKRLAHLEELLNENKLIEIDDYISEYDLFESEYHMYSTIGRVASDVKEHTEKADGEIEKALVNEDPKRLYTIYSLCMDYDYAEFLRNSTEGYYLADACDYLEEQIMECAKEKYGLTEEDIIEGSNHYGESDGELFMALYEEAYEYIKGLQ